MKTRNSINSRLRTSFILSSVLPIIFLLVCFNVISFFTFVRRESQNVQIVTSSIAQSVQYNFHELDTITNTYYLYNGVFKEVEALNNPKLYQFYDDLMMRDLENNYTMAMTKHIYTAQFNIRSIVFFPTSNNNDTAYLVGKQTANLIPINYADYGSASWFKKAVETSHVSEFYPYHKAAYLNDETVFSNIRAIRNPDTQKHIGVIKIDIAAESMNDLLQSFNIGVQDRITVVDAQGNTLISQDRQISNLNKTGLTFDHGKFYFQSIQPIEKSSWSVVYQSSFDTFFKGVILVALISLAFIVMLLYFSHFLFRKESQHIISEVNLIKESLEGIRLGRFERVTTIPRTSEFNVITHSLNDMMDRLEHNIEREYLLVIQQKHAEFKALQSQINPHFLYNILNGFIGLNRMGEVEVLERAIINLTRLFRYTTDQGDFVNLGQEVEFLKGFLELELLKHPNGISYMITADPDLMGYKIPKLLIQPLVENSIKHGLGSTRTSIHIDLTITRVEGGISIIIKDNGVGFDPMIQSNNSSSIGLQNTIERVQYFDQHSQFEIVSDELSGTEIKITLSGAMDIHKGDI